MTAPLRVADIGGTNARFGLIDGAGIREARIFPCTAFPSLEAVVRAYLGAIPPSERPRHGAFCIAGPVTGDAIKLTNLPWSFSTEAVRVALGFERLVIVNDFTAVALSVPRLTEADRLQIGGGAPEPGAVIAVIGPGSGLGVSGLTPGPQGWRALSGEGGHVTLPPVNDREGLVLAQLRKTHDHVSAERILSGPGLATLYETLSLIDGHNPAPLTPAAVTAKALDGSQTHCVEAVEMFCAMLGTVAGNLALTLGARGGVYIAGGIVPKLGPLFARSRFRTRFQEKGRLSGYLTPIPTYVITHELPAFLGLAEAFG